MGRGKSWSADEDMFLARSFVHVSHDSLVGADQKSTKFYERVLEQFLAFVPGSGRTSQALASRWKEVQTACAKFSGHFSTVKAVVKSGWQEADYVEAALKTYLEIECSAFPHRLVWEYLGQHFPKFMEGLLSKVQTPCKASNSKRMRPDEGENPDPAEDVPTLSLKRPHGTKKAKSLLRAQESDNDDDVIEVQRLYVDQAKRRNDLIAEQNQLAQEQNRLALFSVDLSALDDTAKQFHLLKRKMEFAKLQKEAAQFGVDLN